MPEKEVQYIWERRVPLCSGNGGFWHFVRERGVRVCVWIERRRRENTIAQRHKRRESIYPSPPLPTLSFQYMDGEK